MMDEKRGWSRYYGDDDLETGPISYDTTVRNGFIRKVFGILSIQLALTVLISLPIILVDSVSNYIFQNQWVFILTMVASFGVLIGMTCVPGAMKSYPTNYILLFAFTAMEGVLVGVISATYSKDVVLLAGTITVGITVVLTIFALQTKWDFTLLGGVLVSVLFAMVMASIIMIFLPRSRILSLVYSSIGAVLFCVYLVYDVQLIAGGRRYEFDVDDYIPAALAVYLDIINIFLFLLRIMNR